MEDFKMKFTKDDHQKFIEFLNFVAKNAKFDGMLTKDMIDYVKLIGAMQNMVPKIEANILEIVKVTKGDVTPELPRE